MAAALAHPMRKRGLELKRKHEHYIHQYKKNIPENIDRPNHNRTEVICGASVLGPDPMKAIALEVTAAVPNTSVLVPITTSVAPGASEMGVPETVIILPGFNVCLSITNSEAVFAVYVLPPKVITAALVVVIEACPKT